MSHPSLLLRASLCTALLVAAAPAWANGSHQPAGQIAATSNGMSNAGRGRWVRRAGVALGATAVGRTGWRLMRPSRSARAAVRWAGAAATGAVATGYGELTARVPHMLLSNVASPSQMIGTGASLAAIGTGGLIVNRVRDGFARRAEAKTLTGRLAQRVTGGKTVAETPRTPATQRVRTIARRAWTAALNQSAKVATLSAAAGSYLASHGSQTGNATMTTIGMALAGTGVVANTLAWGRNGVLEDKASNTSSPIALLSGLFGLSAGVVTVAAGPGLASGGEFGPTLAGLTLSLGAFAASALVDHGSAQHTRELAAKTE